MVILIAARTPRTLTSRRILRRLGRLTTMTRGPIHCLGAALGLALVLLSAGCVSEPEGLSPEQVAVFAEAVDVEVVVVAARNAMRYETARVEAPAGATVRLVIDNTETTSPAMVHNVVVVRSAGEVERIGSEVVGGDIPDDPAIVTATPLAGPGERLAVVFTMPPPGEYPFLCTYPGHARFMQGTLVSTPAPDA